MIDPVKPRFRTRSQLLEHRRRLNHAPHLQVSHERHSVIYEHTFKILICFVYSTPVIWDQRSLCEVRSSQKGSSVSTALAA